MELFSTEFFWGHGKLKANKRLRVIDETVDGMHDTTLIFLVGRFRPRNRAVILAAELNVR